jgi:hypothetical protein
MQQRANNERLLPGRRTSLHLNRAANNDQNYGDNKTVQFFHVDLPFKSEDILIRFNP